MSLLTEKYANVVAAVNQASAPLTGSTRISGAVYAPVVRYDSSASIIVSGSDYIIVAQHSGATTVELPAASSNTGRVLILRSNTGSTLSSTESNVIKVGSNTAQAALTYADYQAWVEIVSDGTHWIITRGFEQAHV